MSAADYEGGIDLSEHDSEFLQSLLPDGGRSASRAFEFVAVGDLEYRAPEFLIDGLIETDIAGMIFGDPGCGKSFIAVDIGLSVATGTPFHGRKVKQGAVFYIAGEGHNGLARRFAAWAKDRDVSIKLAPLFKSNRAAQFLDRESAAAVSAAVESLADIHGPPALIIIDTLARNFGPGDENSTSDMNCYVAALDDLRAHYPGCAILTIHHTGHGDKSRGRGAISLPGALDFNARAEKVNGVVTLTTIKMKDAEEPAPLAFEFCQVDLGGGASSVALRSTMAPAERAAAPSFAQRLALETFIDAAAVDGVEQDDGTVAVRQNDWREAFFAKHHGDSDQAKKQAFYRVRKDLDEKGLISVDQGLYRWNEPAIPMLVKARKQKGTSGTNGDNVPGCPGAEAA